jgi:hypothetical protein
VQIGNKVIGTTVEPTADRKEMNLAFGLLAAATGRVEWGSTGDIENGNTSHTYIIHTYVIHALIDKSLIKIRIVFFKHFTLLYENQNM